MNFDSVKYTISTCVADVLSVNCAIAPLREPIIFSPKTDAVLRLRPEINVNLSKDGAAVFKDSNTPTTLITSGTLRDISLSSTLKP